MIFLLTVAGKMYVTLQPESVDISCTGFLPTLMYESMSFAWQESYCDVPGQVT
jgi:hypothetical protein